jgi:hypothetical protein
VTARNASEDVPARISSTGVFEKNASKFSKDSQHKVCVSKEW